MAPLLCLNNCVLNKKNLLKHLHTYLPKSTVDQELIFLNWVERIQNFYKNQAKNTNYVLNDDEIFYDKKIFRFFFADWFLAHSPFRVPQMNNGVSLLREAYDSGKSKKIVIYADRDADGLTSAAQIYIFLRDFLKWPIENLVALTPLVDDKYGITDDVTDRIFEHSPDILICLDCGSSNKIELQKLKMKQQKLQCIILDHHFLPEKEQDYPEVDAFINPRVLSCDNTEYDHCTATLTLKLIWALVYSFTSEYNKIIAVKSKDKIILLQNGVVLKQETASAHKTISFVNTEDGDIDGNAHWNNLVKTNATMHKIQNYLKLYPDALSDIERVWIWQTLSFPKLKKAIEYFLPFSGIGTVADMMPLIDDNRLVVSSALNVLNTKGENTSVGLKQLIQVMTTSGDRFFEQDIGFSIAPALNAPGRLGESKVALDLLIENDPLAAMKLANRVKEINEERKSLSKKGVELISADLEKSHDTSRAAFLCYHAEVHRGISGLIAGKLSVEYKKPVAVLVNDGDALRGSIRAYQHENVLALLRKLEPLLIQFGGHLQAAGFSLAYDMREKFEKEFYLHAEQMFSKSESDSEANNEKDLLSDSLTRSFGAPIILNDKQIVLGSWESWLSFAPYGILNPHPVLRINATQGIKITDLGKSGEHVRLSFANINNNSIEGVWFFHKGEINNIEANNPPALLAEPHLNYFRGRLKYQLKINGIDNE